MAVVKAQHKPIPPSEKVFHQGIKLARRKHDELGSLKSDVRECDVANPYFNSAHRASSSNPAKVRAFVNIRESAVGTLYKRGHISEAQWAAAGRFRMYWEKSGAKGTVAIDYRRVQVDGGKMQDPLSDRTVDAVQRLNDCMPVLGRRTFELMVKVVGQGMEIADIAQTQREKKTFSDYLKDGLEDLAAHWGYKNKK